LVLAAVWTSSSMVQAVMSVTSNTGSIPSFIPLGKCQDPVSGHVYVVGETTIMRVRWI
jgi:hypothetical protein